jgi:uncharacterized protein
MSFRKSGEHIVIRGIGFRRLWWAMPATIVEDTSKLIAVYWRSGTRWKDVREHATADDLLSNEKADIIDKTWSETDVLMLAIPGESHSVWIMWEEGHTKIRCWYINLESPLKRTRLGFDEMDHELDIVISPDRSNWWWKDEEAFKEMELKGVFTTDEVKAIRKEGERAIRQMQMGESPFCDNWEKWMPPLEWIIPELPIGWDKISIDDD